jgi:hypothetical protein
MLYRVHLAWKELELATLVVIGTDCIGSYKSNYRMITTMTVPILNGNSLKLCMLVYYHMKVSLHLHDYDCLIGPCLKELLHFLS